MAKRKVKIKKSSAEPDEFLSLTQRLLARVSERPKETAAAAAGLVVVVLLVLMALFFKEKALEKRIEEVASAVSEYHEGRGTERDTSALRQELARLAEAYSSTPSGDQALFGLGSLLAEEGEYESAVEAFRKVQERHPADDTFAVASSLALAYTYRLMDKEEVALTIFQGLLEKEAAAIPRSQVLLEVGTISEGLGRKEEAAEAYRSVMESHPETTWSDRASKRLEALEGA